MPTPSVSTPLRRHARPPSLSFGHEIIFHAFTIAKRRLAASAFLHGHSRLAIVRRGNTPNARSFGLPAQDSPELTWWRESMKTHEERMAWWQEAT